MYIRTILDALVSAGATTYYKSDYSGVVGALWAQVFAIPLVLGLLLWQRRDELQFSRERQKFGFLYNGYRGDMYLWELFIIVRKAMLAVVVVSFYSDMNSLYSAVRVIQVFSIFATTYCRPFQKAR